MRRILFYLLITLFLISCIKENENIEQVSDTPTSIRTAYDGRDFFKGLILVDGPVADSIPSFNSIPRPSLTTPERDLLDSLYHAVMVKIDSLDNSFFNNLEEAVYSDDHYDIETEILNGVNLFMAALPLLNGFDEILLLDSLFYTQIDINSYDFNDSIDVAEYLDDVEQFYQTNIDEEEISQLIVGPILIVGVVVIAVGYVIAYAIDLVYQFVGAYAAVLEHWAFWSSGYNTQQNQHDLEEFIDEIVEAF